MGRRQSGGLSFDWRRCFRHWQKPRPDSLRQPKPIEPDEVDGMLPYIDAEKGSDILIVRKIDPCIEVNGQDHQTSKYEVMRRDLDPALVVRRGQSFRLELNISRRYTPVIDGISFIFTVEEEDKPSFGQGSLVAIPLLPKPDRHQTWNAVIDNQTDDALTVKITPSSDCIIGKWKLEVDTKIINNGAYSFAWPTELYILYNPWCRDDQVYMKSVEWRDECILEDVGLIFRGTANRLRPTIWKYAQFEKNILQAALFIIRHVGKVHGRNASDPILTCRALGAAVNSVDDEGVVMGNWGQDHSDGTAPSKWIGSMEILHEYYKKKKPVKFGQCWVFSGVLTTVCRAIGIPARTVTNYSSAHDTQSSLTVDYFVNEQGDLMEELNSDSVWNFHVWNEVWMQRPDMSSGRFDDYGGWQAVDSTPQEASDGVYRCGPASVEAVRRGEIQKPYDVSFVFAEVNADQLYWRYTGPTQPLKLLSKDIYGIGKLISTKTPGTFEREDITVNYKYPERSLQERATMLRALQQAKNQFSRYYLNETFNDVFFNFELRDDIKIGEEFDVILQMVNRNKVKGYKVEAILRVDAMTYTGRVRKNVRTETYHVAVDADSTHEVKLNLTFNEYRKHLIDQASFRISCLATVQGTEFEYYAQDDFRVRKPDVKMAVQGTPQLDLPLTVDVWLENPLPISLRKCEFRIEPPGQSSQIRVRLSDSVPAGEKVLAKFDFTPTHVGKQTIAAKFISKELNDVDGFLQIMVVLPVDGIANEPLVNDNDNDV